MDNLSLEMFQPRTVDKVERLLDILEEMQRHPDLRGKLAMHGGTAINLFMLDMPRLSVDIDISYVGSLGREGMVAERPVIERGIEEVGRALGYEVSVREGGHAGKTFVLRYRGDWGFDHVKIDCIYMNRSPLISPKLRSCPIRPDVEVLMFDDRELAGGKVKAYFDRVKVRDLYDVSNLKRHFDGLSSDVEVHRSVLYYASLSACFPFSFEKRTHKFIDRQKEFEDQLLPMLKQSEERPILQKLILDAEDFTERYVLPRTESEREYLRLFASGDFRPELLFADIAMADAASKSPEALWKMQNLKKISR